jgi:hypothetical protein
LLGRTDGYERTLEGTCVTGATAVAVAVAVNDKIITIIISMDKIMIYLLSVF